MIDYYACQSNLPCVSILKIALFSRTCFKPCQDYIETCIDVKMIEALGLVHQSQKKPTFIMHIPLVNPIEPKFEIFFHKHYERTVSQKEKQVSLT